jgi:hypothetical protein
MLKEVTSSYETFLNFYQTTCRHIPEGSNFTAILLIVSSHGWSTFISNIKWRRVHWRRSVSQINRFYHTTDNGATAFFSNRIYLSTHTTLRHIPHDGRLCFNLWLRPSQLESIVARDVMVLELWNLCIIAVVPNLYWLVFILLQKL